MYKRQVGVAADDWGLPLSVQRQIRGGFLDPVRAVAQLPGQIVDGELSEGVNLIFVAVLVTSVIVLIATVVGTVTVALGEEIAPPWTVQLISFAATTVLLLSLIHI